MVVLHPRHGSTGVKNAAVSLFDLLTSEKIFPFSAKLLTLLFLFLESSGLSNPVNRNFQVFFFFSRLYRQIDCNSSNTKKKTKAFVLVFFFLFVVGLFLSWDYKGGKDESWHIRGRNS